MSSKENEPKNEDENNKKDGEDLKNVQTQVSLVGDPSIYSLTTVESSTNLFEYSLKREGRNVSPYILEEKVSSFDNLFLSESNEIITQEPGVSNLSTSWLSGGTFGSRSAILMFKSSALASPTETSIQEKPGYKLHVTYKVLQAETKLLSKLLECHGITEVAPNSSDFNLLWTGSHPKPGTLRSLAPHQRVNHFPRSYELTRKDRLFKNIERMQHLKGYKNFDFIPQTFIMPLEYRELCTSHHRVRGPWIVKPVASSRGRGIFIVENPNQVPLEEPVVVAKYISNPLLIAGHKCDIRLYVVVTSFNPLLVYIYEEGLVRFATVKYDTSHKQLWNPCMHLCNYSINKYHSDYVKSDDPSAENVGHKWTLSALLRHLKSEGKDTVLLMSQIEDMVIKAVLASANSIITACKMFVPYSNNCFELFGFDILIDKNMKPWLLEVNLSPSLNCESPLDVRLKSAMLADLLSLIGIPAVDPILRTVADPKPILAIKTKFSNCRRVHSADGLSNTLPKNTYRPRTSKTGMQLPTPSPLTAEEVRVLKNASAQFERRGGFVRIFPSADTWTKYAQYLDPTTGIPITGSPSSHYNLNVNHNYNQLLYNSFFPNNQPTSGTITNSKMSRSKSSSMGSRINMSGDSNKEQIHRQGRYERMLSQGHKSSLTPCKIIRETHNVDLKKKILEMLKNGKKITQREARKTFSHYLGCVLRRIATLPDQSDQVEVVLTFLQRASNYLRTPFSIKTPSENLEYKDRAAIVAKQLNDFLYLYNRETEAYVEKDENPGQIPVKLYREFLETAQENDLEEVLIYQTMQTSIPSTGGGAKTAVHSILKCVPKLYGLKRSVYKGNKGNNLRVSSAS